MEFSHIIFVHDHKFINLNEEYYSEGKFTDEVFDRYNVFDANIHVISRVLKNQEVSNLNKITTAHVSFIPVTGVSFFSIFIINFIANIKLMISELKRTDALIIRLPSFLGIFTLIVNIFFRKKYFIEFVGDPKEALISSKHKISLLFKCFIYIFYVLNKFFVKKADGVIYVTKYDLQKRYPTKKLQTYASNVEVKIKPLVIDLNLYTLKDKKNIKVGLIGSFNNEYKGIDTALNAISLLKNQNCIVQLHILGSGKLKEHYVKMANKLEIANQVHFDGFLAGGGEVLGWLKDLDLYIQPSRTEGLPRALIEAMSVGLPTVATRVGGIPELLPDEFLVPLNDSLELAEKIKMLIYSQQLRYEQGRANYNKAKEYDSIVLEQRRTKFWSQAKAIVEKDLK